MDRALSRADTIIVLDLPRGRGMIGAVSPTSDSADSRLTTSPLDAARDQTNSSFTCCDSSGDGTPTAATNQK